MPSLQYAPPPRDSLIHPHIPLRSTYLRAYSPWLRFNRSPLTSTLHCTPFTRPAVYTLLSPLEQPKTLVIPTPLHPNRLLSAPTICDRLSFSCKDNSLDFLVAFPPATLALALGSLTHPRQQRPRRHGCVGRPQGEPPAVLQLKHREGRALHRGGRVEGQVGPRPDDGTPLGQQVRVSLPQDLLLGGLRGRSGAGQKMASGNERETAVKTTNGCFTIGAGKGKVGMPRPETMVPLLCFHRSQKR